MLWNEKLIVAEEGRSIATILRDLGATAGGHWRHRRVLGPRGRDGGISEGQKLRISDGAGRGGKRVQPSASIVPATPSIEAVVGARRITGKYVAVDVQSVDTEVAEKPRRTTRTTQRACASIRASTRPRCATRSRGR